jgi:hypothetical protein
MTQTSASLAFFQRRTMGAPERWCRKPAEPGKNTSDDAAKFHPKANRRRFGSVIDQPALDRDLRRLLAERGVFPEFIAAEFERVMQAVFPTTRGDHPP